MLHSIGNKRAAREPSARVLPSLEDCHDRIRRHVAIAMRLGSQATATAPDAAQAASQLIGYFVRSLPNHSADEDLTIAPRLRDRPELAQLTATIADQHRAIDATLARLVPLWRAVAADPSQRGALLEELAEHAARLQAQFDEHLGLEERQLFPVIDQIPDAMQQTMVAEMIARRTDASAS